MIADFGLVVFVLMAFGAIKIIEYYVFNDR